MSRRPIGVFDSGIGGLSILRSLRSALPAEDFVYYADTGNAPYGERGDAFVTRRSLAIARELVDERGAKLLVVACNTATAAAVAAIRAAWPALPVVGVEPALKPALAATRSGRVVVFATRGTLGSAKFQALHRSLGTPSQVVLQPCDGLAAAIEAGDTPQVQALCARYVALAGPFGDAPGQADTLVLGCTHYAFAIDVLQREVGPGVRILETGEPVARQVARLLTDNGSRRPEGGTGTLTLLGTGAPGALEAAAARWLPPAVPA